MSSGSAGAERRLSRRDARRRDGELRRVYRDHVSAVYSFFAFSVAKGSAEDLTSTTFERVIKAWGSYDPKRGKERTWILTIARNALTDHLRRERHRVTVSTDEHPGLLEVAGSSEDASGPAAVQDSFRTLIAGLGEREREVLALRYGADMAVNDIAELLGLTSANVHQIASRSLRRLRKGAEPGVPASGADRHRVSPGPS